ncbi:MAG: hypothetical protein V2A79_05045 [Planctomycetota bacterium]
MLTPLGYRRAKARRFERVLDQLAVILDDLPEQQLSHPPQALDAGVVPVELVVVARLEGSLRAVGQSTIEKVSQVPQSQEIAECPLERTERM